MEWIVLAVLSAVFLFIMFKYITRGARYHDMTTRQWINHRAYDDHPSTVKPVDTIKNRA